MTKPPYRVPSMDEIRVVPWNGFNAISTFSGCGGSSLGYRMAGFRILWANEFIEAAREVYRVNSPGTPIDPRDIRAIQPEEILEAIGMKPGELDLLDGSPPCASFSTAGKREEGWGKVKKYSDTHQRVDDLFFQFSRILTGVMPKVFVAENVSGLVKGVAKGYFKEILQALKDAGYHVRCKVLDAAWLGVPQHRQRTIFIGVRDDLGIEPAFPKPLPYTYSVRDALPWVVRGKYGEKWKQADDPSPTVSAGMTYNPETSHQGLELVEAYRAVEDTGGDYGRGDITDRPAPTVRASGVGQLYLEHDTDISRFAIGKEYDRVPQGKNSKRYMNLAKPHPDRPCPTVTQTGGVLGAASVVHPTERRKFTIDELKRICGFPDDFVLTGTYQQQWERLGRAVPPVMMSHIARVVRDEILSRIGGET